MNWAAGSVRDPKSMLCSMSLRAQLVLRWLSVWFSVRRERFWGSECYVEWAAGERLLAEWVNRLKYRGSVFKKSYAAVYSVEGEKHSKETNKCQTGETFSRLNEPKQESTLIVTITSIRFNLFLSLFCMHRHSLGGCRNQRFFHLYFCDIFLFENTSRTASGNSINLQSHV